MNKTPLKPMLTLRLCPKLAAIAPKKHVSADPPYIIKGMASELVRKACNFRKSYLTERAHNPPHMPTQCPKDMLKAAKNMPKKLKLCIICILVSLLF